MKITDIIRTVIDLVDQNSAEQQEQEIATVDLVINPPDSTTDELTIIKQLSGMTNELEYANKPNEIVAPLSASFPGGDDMHHRKNPADIRTNAPSMYPGYQAEKP
jgi:hypothetical protein